MQLLKSSVYKLAVADTGILRRVPMVLWDVVLSAKHHTACTVPLCLLSTTQLAQYLSVLSTLLFLSLVLGKQTDGVLYQSNKWLQFKLSRTYW